MGEFRRYNDTARPWLGWWEPVDDEQTWIAFLADDGEIVICDRPDSDFGDGDE